jgi:catechol 2,3-dioxygenase-like lactoylglutathione lyase family enzyme
LSGKDGDAAAGPGGAGGLIHAPPLAGAMISGAHVVVYSTDADADRAFLRDVLGLANVDAGGGWPIFALPPAEVAVHPGESGGEHELFLTCDDLAATVKALKAKKVKCDPPRDVRWGILTSVHLPGGGRLGLYQPKHPLAHGAGAGAQKPSKPKRA